MSRRKIITKQFSILDNTYNNYFINIFISKILINGKKRLAENIIHKTFAIISKRLNIDPIKIFEKAIKNTTPLVKIKTRKVGGSRYKIPIEINHFKGSNTAVKWLLIGSKKRPGKSVSINLANELIDASNNLGEAYKKKQEIHKIAESNKAFVHFQY